MPAFRDMLPGETLDHFHQRCVVPTPEETSSRNAEIDGFVRFLHSEFNTPPYTVNRVLKGGSLGKGTAVRGSADIDLVVVLNGLSGVSDLVKNRRFLLDRLHQEATRYKAWRGTVVLKEQTPFSLCYTLNGQEMDVLPALNAERCVEHLYREMRVYSGGPRAAGQELSASLAPLQIDFVKPQTEAVKRVIRLLKLWKKENGVKIRSYTLELLTIHADRTTQWRNTDDLFRRVLSLLADCRSIQVAFNVNYNSAEYTRSHQTPYVIDPANPFMNTLDRMNPGAISRAASAMLQSL
ncbi:2'-5'-oligoadenylate synthase 1-like isoform X1 [Babylonia areolata]|uniref:2'-5'-oligoadenylate synthase 1-like isoform X1 n=1 Tax=Babylonia areolata TaxID=304850 RepID=UPI003FD6993E